MVSPPIRSLVNPRRLNLVILLVTLGNFWPVPLGAREAFAATDAEAQRLYTEGVKTLLSEKCISCHGPLDQQAGLRLDAGVMIHRGGDSGEAIIPGQPDAGTVLERVTHEDVDVRMPPAEEGTPLTDEELALLRRWIAAGAAYPADEPLLERPEDHWAFQPLVRPAIPGSQFANAPESTAAEPRDHDAWGLNPIDAFLQAERDRAGVITAGRASEETLLRRLTLTLTGLPPTAEQRAAFLRPRRDAAGSARATAQMADALLADPAYAQRWARHWMDIWRYSDWDGYRQELRGSQRHIWHWRDWIIESLAEDKPYDQMIVEMLAADEAKPLDAAALRGTGFLARNYHKSNRNIWLDATVEHTAKAFLGLTIDCAKCHDHKYDPISQEEYYQFRAIFEPHQVRTDLIAGQADPMVNGVPRAYDADLEAKTQLLIAGDEKRPDESRAIRPLPPKILGLPMSIQPVALPRLAHTPELKPEIRATLVAVEDRKVAAAAAALQQAQSGQDAAAIALARLKWQVATSGRDAFVVRYAADAARLQGDNQADDLAATAARLQRAHGLAKSELTVAEKQAAHTTALAASQQQPEDEKLKKQLATAAAALEQAQQERAAAVAALEASAAEYDPVIKPFPATSSGRRLALALWITDRQNPLTARVAVNHIWLRHFGKPLVENVFDFGLRSPQPRQQQLLDYLAMKLIENQWQMKHLHRLIVTSAAFAMDSAVDAATEAHNRRIDPDHETYWRFSPRRLEAEAIRDSLLAVAEQLDRQIGGPDIDHNQGETVHRRSLYFRHANEKQMVMLTIFDAPNPGDCYRRDSSVIPQQALVLANSSLAREMSQSLARQLAASTSGDDAAAEDRFISLAFQQVLGRAPRDPERQACQEFLQVQTQARATAGQPSEASADAPAADPTASQGDAMMKAKESLIHVLINHNDFITVR